MTRCDLTQFRTDFSLSALSRIGLLPLESNVPLTEAKAWCSIIVDLVLDQMFLFSARITDICEFDGHTLDEMLKFQTRTEIVNAIDLGGINRVIMKICTIMMLFYECMESDYDEMVSLILIIIPKLFPELEITLGHIADETFLKEVYEMYTEGNFELLIHLDNRLELISQYLSPIACTLTNDHGLNLRFEEHQEMCLKFCRTKVRVFLYINQLKHKNIIAQSNNK